MVREKAHLQIIYLKNILLYLLEWYAPLPGHKEKMIGNVRIIVIFLKNNLIKRWKKVPLYFIKNIMDLDMLIRKMNGKECFLLGR